MVISFEMQLNHSKIYTTSIEIVTREIQIAFDFFFVIQCHFLVMYLFGYLIRFWAKTMEINAQIIVFYMFMTIIFRHPSRQFEKYFIEWWKCLNKKKIRSNECWMRFVFTRREQKKKPLDVKSFDIFFWTFFFQLSWTQSHPEKNHISCNP